MNSDIISVTNPYFLFALYKFRTYLRLIEVSLGSTVNSVTSKRKKNLLYIQYCFFFITIWILKESLSWGPKVRVNEF